MSRTPEELYFELGRLVAEMPELTTGAITPEVTRWLQRAAGLVERTGGSLADTIQLKVAADNLDGLLRARNAHTIVTIVHRALARVELKVPAEGRGAFVAVGNAFEAFAAMRKILASATSDVLFVDARAEATILTDYAVLAPEDVTVRVLTEQAAHSESIVAAAHRWEKQFGEERRLHVRLAPTGALPERLIVLDGATAWGLPRPFNRLGDGANATLIRMPADAAVAEIASHAAKWEASVPL